MGASTWAVHHVHTTAVRSLTSFSFPCICSDLAALAGSFALLGHYSGDVSQALDAVLGESAALLLQGKNHSDFHVTRIDKKNPDDRGLVQGLPAGGLMHGN